MSARPQLATTSSTGNVELLVLDFAGVCTPSADELIMADANPALIAVRPGCLEVVLIAQRAGVIVAILSNEISTEWVASVPLMSQVDRVVACSDNNIYKPDRRAFQRCLLLTGAAAERTLVVDDDDDNITVAHSLGMQTVLFDVEQPEASWSLVRKALS